MNRRGALRCAAAGGLWLALSGHSPYRQWEVYRKTRLIVLVSAAEHPSVILGSMLATTILASYPTARAFQSVSSKTLARLCYDGRRRVGEELAGQILEAARHSVGQHHGPAYRVQVRYACEDLDLLRLTDSVEEAVTLIVEWTRESAERARRVAETSTPLLGETRPERAA